MARRRPSRAGPSQSRRAPTVSVPGEGCCATTIGRFFWRWNRRADVAVFCDVSGSLRHPGQGLIALLVVGLLGCASPARSVAPVVRAASSATPSAPLDRYEDGLPRVIAGLPVLRGDDAIAHARAATDASPFLLGGWVTNVPGVVVACPLSLGVAGASSWLAPCGQPTFSDLAGDPNAYLVARGELTFHLADVSTLQSGPLILRVHVRDPRAAQCGTQQAVCARAMVVEAVVWSGDTATAPHPLTLTLVSAALRALTPGAAPDVALVPLGDHTQIVDCGTVLPATRDYVVLVPAAHVPAVSLVEIGPSPEALARALPIPVGVSGALTQGALLAIVRSSSTFACRWLRLGNVAVLVRTSDALPTSADRVFLDRLVAALDTARDAATSAP